MIVDFREKRVEIIARRVRRLAEERRSRGVEVVIVGRPLLGATEQELSRYLGLTPREGA